MKNQKERAALPLGGCKSIGREGTRVVKKEYKDRVSSLLCHCPVHVGHALFSAFPFFFIPFSYIFAVAFAAKKKRHLCFPTQYSTPGPSFVVAVKIPSFVFSLFTLFALFHLFHSFTHTSIVHRQTLTSGHSHHQQYSST